MIRRSTLIAVEILLGLVAALVIGVGGMRPSRLHDVAAAGAAGFAAIGLFAKTSADQFPDVMHEANAAFDEF
jgi:thiamine monophosphate synthase